MGKYLIRLTPLEPYFFGGENTFRIKEKNKYYISSLICPSAATIIGMLRYEILKQSGALRTDGKYTRAEKEKCNELVGESSYKVGQKNNFGKLKGITPVFLMNGEDAYIKTPLNHKANQTQYTPIVLDDEPYETSDGEIRVPKEGEFKAKDTVGEDSYFNIRNREINKHIFKYVEKTSNAKAKNEEAFFKKKFCMLSKGFSFAVVADIDEIESANDTSNIGREKSLLFHTSGEEPYHDICYMGREKSAFSIQVKAMDFDIENKIKNALKGTVQQEFYYVFGDVFLKEPLKYSDFAMINTSPVRMLSSEIKEKEGSLKISCISEVYQVIKAGSIFYADDLSNSAYKESRFGFNKIIKIGGME